MSSEQSDGATTASTHDEAISQEAAATASLSHQTTTTRTTTPGETSSTPSHPQVAQQQQQGTSAAATATATATLSSSSRGEGEGDTNIPTGESTSSLGPRQVIAVSASKGPAAFFNLARKFLVTDEMCDLSALEGAIVSAVDAAHLLERSQLATIVRVHTSYVSVEPKRRKQTPQTTEQSEEGGTAGRDEGSTKPTSAQSSGAQVGGTTAAATIPQQGHQPSSSGTGNVPPSSVPSSSRQSGGSGSRSVSGGRELRRARIVITVKRTESYKRWLEENPLQAIIAGDADTGQTET